MINDHLIIFALSFQQHFDQNVVFVARITFSGPKLANRLGERTYLHGSASEIRPLLLCTSDPKVGYRRARSFVSAGSSIALYTNKPTTIGLGNWLVEGNSN